MNPGETGFKNAFSDLYRGPLPPMVTCYRKKVAVVTNHNGRMNNKASVAPRAFKEPFPKVSAKMVHIIHTILTTEESVGFINSLVGIIVLTGIFLNMGKLNKFEHVCPDRVL